MTTGAGARPAAAPAAGRGRRARLLRWGFLVAVLVFGVLAVQDRYASVRDSVARLSPLSLAAALVLVLASLWLSMLSWRRILAGLGSPLPLRAAAGVYFVGQLGKYLPGSLWPVLAQMELAREHGVPRTRTGTGALVAIGVGLLGSLLVAGALLPFAVQPAGWRLALVAALVTCLVMCSPAVLNRVLETALRLLRRGKLEHPLSGRVLASATGLAAAGWVLQGVAVFAVAASLGSDNRLLPLSVGGYAAASAAGILVLIAPAGIGVREPVLVAALGPAVGVGSALVVALVLRLVTTVGDLVLGGAFALSTGTRSRHEAPAGLPD